LRNVAFVILREADGRPKDLTIVEILRFAFWATLRMRQVYVFRNSLNFKEFGIR